MIQQTYASNAGAALDYDLNRSLHVADTRTYRLPSTAYSAGDVRMLQGYTGVTLRCTAAGTTSAGAFPYSESASSVTDGTVVWTVHRAWQGGGGGTTVSVSGTTIIFT